MAVPEEINNRRWFVKPQAMRPNPFGRTNDKVRMNPPRGTGLLIRPAGPADAAVSFLSVRTPKGKPVANYGLHYVGGIPGGQLSADYFGEFARQVGKRLDGDSSFVGIMSNGASGDVNNYQFLEPRPRAEPFVRVRAVAARVADRVAAQHNKVAFQTGATIRMSEQELELGVRQPDSDDLKYAQELLAKAANPERLTTDQVYAQETVRLSKAAPTVRIRLQAISIGELAIVAIPCEVFAEIGLELKRRSPFPMTFVIALANGYNGYLPTPGQHELGGYETWRSGWSYLETQASTKITDNLIGQLNAFRKAPDASSKSGTSD